MSCCSCRCWSCWSCGPKVCSAEPRHEVAGMRRLVLAFGLLVLATLPFWVGNSYYTNIASQILLYAVFALGLNVLVGYAGLVSLGHAGLFGIAAYAGALFINAGAGHLLAILGALGVTLVASAAFAVLALRGTGLGFVMITVALGQIVWGIAYRWISITNGDNGVSVATRPAPFGLSLTTAPGFYWATLIVFLVTLGALAVFAASPFGPGLRGAGRHHEERRERLYRAVEFRARHDLCRDCHLYA